MIEKLEYVESIHEQREFKRKVIPVKGAWLEIGKFTEVLESFDIRERWKCVDVKEEKGGFNVTIKKIDHIRQRREAKHIIDQVMEKHGEALIESMLVCLVKGIKNKRNEINNALDRISTHKVPQVLQHLGKRRAIIESIKKRKDKISKEQEMVKHLKEELEKVNKDGKENGVRYIENPLERDGIQAK